MSALLRRAALCAVTVSNLTMAGAAWAGSTYDITPSTPNLQSLFNSLQPGDVVDAASGTYNQVFTLTCDGTTADPITIQGVGATRPIFDATGLDTSGNGGPRGVFEIQGDDIILNNLTLTGAVNSQGSAAGVRIRQDLAHNTVIENCLITGNDNGVTGGAVDITHLLNNEISFNGSTAGGVSQSHNVYMYTPGTVIAEGNYIHDSTTGENFKSRAHYNVLAYNWIADAAAGSVNLVDESGYTDVPNSNSLMVGNVIVTDPVGPVNHTQVVLFGQDDGGNHNGTLYAYNNTIICNNTNNQALRVNDNASLLAKMVASNNIIFGTKNVVDSTHTPAGSMSGSNNWVPTGSSITPADFTGDITGTDPGFVDLSAGDYELLSSSACVNAGVSGLTYVDGNGVTQDLTVDYSYLLGQGLVPRAQDGELDIGAFELVPEPGSLALVGLGGLALGVRRRRIR